MLLCQLSALPEVKNNNVKIQTDDLQTLYALEKDVQKLEAAMKLFVKQEKAKASAVQELMSLLGDLNA